MTNIIEISVQDQSLKYFAIIFHTTYRRLGKISRFFLSNLGCLPMFRTKISTFGHRFFW